MSQPRVLIFCIYLCIIRKPLKDRGLFLSFYRKVLDHEEDDVCAGDLVRSMYSWMF